MAEIACAPTTTLVARTQTRRRDGRGYNGTQWVRDRAEKRKRNMEGKGARGGVVSVK